MADPEQVRAHLADLYGIKVQAMLTLDQDVILMRRSDGPNWVARIFPAERPLTDVRGDAEILNWLAEEAYPAERCATDDPVSVMEGSPVLVTEAVSGVRQADRRKAIKDAGGIAMLGEQLARLTTLPARPGAPSRPGGAWHHIAAGLPSAELGAARTMLERAEARAPARALSHYSSIAEELDALDGGDGLPVGFVHPDFVMANVVATAAPGMVLVDWAGAGLGPRLWPLAFLLWAEAAKDQRRAALALAGYRRLQTIADEEVERLPAMMRARPLIFGIWHLQNGSRAAATVVEDARTNRQLAETIAHRVAERLRGDQD